MSQQLYTDNPNQDYMNTQTSDTMNDIDQDQEDDDIELMKQRANKNTIPITGSSKNNFNTGIITRPPKSKDDMQPGFAFEWDTPDNGAYGSLVDCFGSIVGGLGLIPCCICCPNPYRRVEQGNVGLITKFGQMYKAADPGLVKVNPVSEKLYHVNVMLKTMEIPGQNCLTKDNVSIVLTSVLYFQIVEPHTAYFSVKDIELTLRERTQTTLRQVIGARNLQDVIERREEIAESIEEIIAQTADSWGVRIESILIKDLTLPPSVSQSLSMAAEAKRIGESKIIQAKAEVESAKLMRKAADILASKPAMQIRYLDAMQNMAKQSNSKVIFMPSQHDVERTAGDAAGANGSNNSYGNNAGNQDSGYDQAKIIALDEATRR
ncbi:hypothetical protein B5S28_g4242 [[Candida] boidinii]|uniref:Unnamed protein product n=1 Tax=Candida boidinii TaxID=5477 RepID=A0ACB5TFG4_CANBO|nr:hypothetical protein B5S28_g4242 [[Candida] boidinii]OWB63810.1 hypothetical protein B5S29_g4821 [[Candida] boidinii]OWB75021.1 hypothetical protein B5S31_g4868 [[Candida] boidinii]OWB80682.1 hypothetical protein B5S32_g4975 [[Candida] boidinii]GME87358.1 unnamed protein product [[Candida] boidinii]